MVYRVAKKDIDRLLNEAIDNKKSSLERMVGDLNNTRIEYPKQELTNEDDMGDVAVTKSREAPILKMPEHLMPDAKNLVDILGNAKTVLTKLGNQTDGAESDELWSYHRKIERIIIDLQRKFKVIH